MSSTCEVVNNINEKKNQSVADYYNGKSIFITGGTGFLGKMYIQKILYSCPGVDKIYMLIRASSAEAAKHRIKQMVENSSRLFKQLNEERPADLLKLVPILGDMSDKNLGIHPDDEILLREEVSFVVHSAATLNMRDLLQDALNINVTGTQNILALAKRMKKLQAFVHISTTFCAMNSDYEFIEEVVYPPAINLNDIPKLQQQYGHMRQPPKSILGNKWNTYVFTKAICENMIHLNRGDLPTAIIRPSLIGSAYIEPYKGWLDAMNFHSFLLMSSTCEVVNNINEKKNQSVADYYNGKSIFITGGTGFLGKMYIQKILYSCPGVDKIYMLIRASSAEAAKHRIKQMVENSSRLFKQLNEERPADLLKLVPILGDMSDKNLGIHPDDEILLREEVSFVVHSAATLNMRDLLQDALNINVTGTQNILALAKRMKKLQAFVHISTTFCAMNSDYEFIEEVVYPPAINLNDIPKLQQQYGHMRQPPKSILGNKWNTYVFTKAICENMIHLNRGDLPTAIIRPSLIGSAYIEPYKGWLDAMNFHSFLLYAVANGQIRLLNIDKNAIWDFIPVDYVANLIILAATKCNRSNAIDVYNCASSFVNPVKISNAISIFISDFVNNQSNKIPFPFMLYLKSKSIYDMLTPILQSTPAYISDFSCLFTGHKPNSVKSYRKFMKLNDDITFYGNRSWKVKSDRVISLFRTLNDEDKKTFPCDPSDIEWVEYFKTYSEAIRNYTLRFYKKSKL